MLKPEATERFRLTWTQAQALGWACEGLQNKEIARKMNVGLKNVESYLTGASHKLGLRGRRQVVVKMYREQLVEFPSETT